MRGNLYKLSNKDLTAILDGIYREDITIREGLESAFNYGTLQCIDDYSCYGDANVKPIHVPNAYIEFVNAARNNEKFYLDKRYFKVIRAEASYNHLTVEVAGSVESPQFDIVTEAIRNSLKYWWVSGMGLYGLYTVFKN